MAETILVIAEQREGKLNRVSFETLAGAQALAKQTGWTVEAAVVGGDNIASLAAEIAKTAVRKVYAIADAALERYTPDGFVAALKGFIETNHPKLVLLPHTYQVRDFAPKLAASLGAVLVSDAVGCRFEGGKLFFTRQMFQGKFAADLSLAGDGPWFASFQTGAYRADQVESGEAGASAPVEQVSAVTGRGHRLRGARHQGAEEHRTRQGPGRCARRRNCCVASHLRRGLAAHGTPGRIQRADGEPEAVPRAWHQRRHSTYRGDERLAPHHRHQQGRRGSDL